MLQVFGHLNYLWGNMPAIDVLNLGKNEGLNYEKDINLCYAGESFSRILFVYTSHHHRGRLPTIHHAFLLRYAPCPKQTANIQADVASGDPRNLMVSINALPTAYKGTCTSVLNDKNMNIVARNIVMLLMSAQLSPLEAAELVLHIWYSARLTQGMLAAIDKYATKAIADTVAKIKDKDDDVMQSKKWIFGTAEIIVRLYKPQWTTLLQILEAKHDVKKTEKERRKIVLAPSRLDYRDRELFNLPGFGRMCSTKFRETGVLAPFGSALDSFECPNPLVFRHHLP